MSVATIALTEPGGRQQQAKLPFETTAAGEHLGFSEHLGFT
jgi:hypothetical protein